VATSLSLGLRLAKAIGDSASDFSTSEISACNAEPMTLSTRKDNGGSAGPRIESGMQTRQDRSTETGITISGTS
jgi:hypothetical protein